MRNQHWLRVVCCLLFITPVILTGCKKQVAAAAPPAPPIQPAPPSPAPTSMPRAAPASIDRGQATSLQWEARNASSVRIEPERPTRAKSALSEHETSSGPLKRVRVRSRFGYYAPSK